MARQMTVDNLVLTRYHLVSKRVQNGTRGSAMADKLSVLIEKARTVRMSRRDEEEQRRSFAYGNTKIENDRITREMVDERAEALKRDK